jgi:hypothetical protein
LRRFSTSVLISIRAPHWVTKATIPNQIATPRANAEYVRQLADDDFTARCNRELDMLAETELVAYRRHRRGVG